MCFKKMGIPKAIAADDGWEFKGRFKDILDGEGVQHIVFTTHLSFIDRFTRTIKKVVWKSTTYKNRLAFVAPKCN